MVHMGFLQNDKLGSKQNEFILWECDIIETFQTWVCVNQFTFNFLPF